MRAAAGDKFHDEQAHENDRAADERDEVIGRRRSPKTTVTIPPSQTTSAPARRTGPRASEHYNFRIAERQDDSPVQIAQIADRVVEAVARDDALDATR